MTRVNKALICFMVLLACRNNNSIENIKVKGEILDFDTKEPVVNAQVMILCWKESELESGDVDFIKKETETDEKGQFELDFERGFKLDIGSIKQGYLPVHYRLEPKVQKDIVQLELKKSKSSENNSKYCGDGRNMYVSARTYYFEKNTIKESIGLNLNTGLNTTELSEADLWVEIKRNDKEIILKTPPYTGLVAFKDDLGDVQPAQEIGYKGEHIIQGNEKGFWIKLSDKKGFSKIFISDRFEKSSQYKDGYFEEVGLSFECEYFLGKTINLSKTTFDLEEFLLKRL